MPGVGPCAREIEILSSRLAKPIALDDLQNLDCGGATNRISPIGRAVSSGTQQVAKAAKEARR